MTPPSRTRTRLAMLLAATALALGSGCSADSSGSPSDAFDARAPLPDCGAVTIAQGDPITLTEDQLACLAHPEGGEAMLEAPTDEGDPIRTYYRAGPDVDGIEYYRDQTQDQNGEQIWTYTSCPVASVDDVSALFELECEYTSPLLEG